MQRLPFGWTVGHQTKMLNSDLGRIVTRRMCRFLAGTLGTLTRQMRTIYATLTNTENKHTTHTQSTLNRHSHVPIGRNRMLVCDRVACERATQHARFGDDGRFERVSKLLDRHVPTVVFEQLPRRCRSDVGFGITSVGLLVHVHQQVQRVLVANVVGRVVYVRDYARIGAKHAIGLVPIERLVVLDGANARQIVERMTTPEALDGRRLGQVKHTRLFVRRHGVHGHGIRLHYPCYVLEALGWF